MIVEKIKQIAKDLNYKFNYGAYEWQNLIDLTENNQIYLLLLWKDTNRVFNDYNVIEKTSYTGEFILCKRSNFQEPDYNYKYENYIKELETEAKNIIKNISICDNLLLEKWSETEVSDQLDTNLDGLKINFQITFS